MSGAMHSCLLGPGVTRKLKGSIKLNMVICCRNARLTQTRLLYVKLMCAPKGLAGRVTLPMHLHAVLWVRLVMPDVPWNL